MNQPLRLRYGAVADLGRVDYARRLARPALTI